MWSIISLPWCRHRHDGEVIHRFHIPQPSQLIQRHDDETQVVGGTWSWPCSRAVHQDCLPKGNPATLGCLNDDCPLITLVALA